MKQKQATRQKPGVPVFAKFLTLFLFFALVFGLVSLQAQTSVNASGGNATGSGGSVSYSVGQLVYTTNTGTSGSVAEGVQQAYEISVVTALEEAKGINLSVSAYPNPTTDYLTLSIDNSVKTNHDLSLLSYQLYDMNGKLLQSKTINEAQTHIAMGNLIRASYLLTVSQNNTTFKTFRIIKN